ncbi:MAG: ABC transporter ATP-binding protein [Nitriliruptoraceae bacterium]
MSVLELRDVSVTYHRKHLPDVTAVAGVSLTVERGQIVGLVGESGCGKSTLGRAASGLLKPSTGEVLFEGERVTPLGRKPRPARERRIQMVFQDPNSSLNGRRKVGDQIADGLELAQELPSKQRRARVAELLELVGLDARAADRYPHEFSGGQRQRICIARALSADPSVIIADEPISALDASAQAQIANLLHDLAKQLDVGLLFISHDLAIVRHIADVVTVMYLGKVAEYGPTTPVWDQPLHPYSDALIGAVLHADGSAEMPEALPGDVPDPADPPPGCRFQTRCPMVMDRCRTEEPVLTPIADGDGRTVACWLHHS